MDKFEKNNRKVALNVLCVKEVNIYPAYISKHALHHEKQIILLMIPNGEGCHYLAVKNLFALLRGITSKYDGNFSCLNCLHFFRTKNKLKSHKKVCGKNTFMML